MKQKTKKRPGLTTVLLSLLFLAGLSLLLYPTISNFWNSIHHFTTIGDYDSQVVQMEHGEYGRLREEAQAYNRDLATLADPHYPPEEMVERYKQTLDVTGNGVMGYVEIPSINCTLPIYHGTDEAVLQIALGHLEWTSLPVGGAGTHSAISGHRGLPSAELLTHIDRLEPGDIFYLHVLDEVLKYRVCDIFVVLPEDTSKLAPVEGKAAVVEGTR